MSEDIHPPIRLSAMTENSLALLEFHKLLRIIADFAHSDASEGMVLELRPLDRREEIEKRLGQVSELLRMIQEGSPLVISPFADITPLLAKVRPEGAVLEGYELAGFMPVLTNLSDIVQQTAGRAGIPFLSEFIGHLTGFPDLLHTLERSIDSEGAILDSASFLLAELRADIRRLEGRIRKRLEEMVRDERVSIFLQDDFITTRSGRWVIPVRMDSKGQVEGVVHDVSKSGETAFVEPLAIINLANELENLIAEQKAEEIRILRSISASIRAAADDIETQFAALVYTDVLCCITSFADQLRMQIPQINESGTISLTGARHPLLMLALQKTDSRREVVPLDVRLGGDTNVMVITGSNAGGKTVTIKTIGLLLSMAQSGMPVPADAASSFPIVRNLLADMGDEQSIEQNLSTFSAHVANISEILKTADDRSLVLIDELGTGTDPDEGAALACAVLKELRGSGALVFATTHLTGIKGFVHRTEGMLNAAMEFDQKALKPLYRLRVGEPGQSHALEIARRYGLPDTIIDAAKGLLGGVKAEFDNLIADLQEKRAAYERALQEIETERKEIEVRSRRLEVLLAEAERKEKEVLAKAYRDASEIISDIKREMYALLDEAKKKERERSREALKRAGELQEQVTAKAGEFDRGTERTLSIDEIMEGDVVHVRSLGYDAPVVEVNLKHNRVKVRAGNKEIEVPASEIAMRKGKPAGAQKEKARGVGPDEAVSSRINLVGLRVDAALSRLEPFLNHASMAGLNEVVVIHGVGTGILMKAIREHLDGHPLVKKFRSGGPQEGGSGVTVVTLV
ncbi:MAG: endonuclease MutS2 [Nitrospirota bacterium]